MTPTPYYRAHPRTYGDNMKVSSFVVFFSGSSPRIRGKPGLRARELEEARLTPAHTGKALFFAVVGGRFPAHPPPAYGESSCYRGGNAKSQGSPPRIRGKLFGRSAGCRSRGLTPAHTGKTVWCPTLERIRRAHPRAYGESDERERGGKKWTGSSPRIRGKRPSPAGDGESVGLIPAHTGKAPADKA